MESPPLPCNTGTIIRPLRKEAAAAPVAPAAAAAAAATVKMIQRPTMITVTYRRDTLMP